MSLDAIWDEPLASPPKPAPTDDVSSPVKRPRQTLFFSDSDDDNDRPPKRATPAPPPSKPDVDALFEDLDKDGEDEDDDLRYKPLAPALDLAKLAKEAEARHARGRQTQTSAPQSAGGSMTGTASGTVGEEGKKKPEDGEKKSRKVPLKLDEERLVAPEGFPSLIEDIKGFKPKGKGNEHPDLNRLLQVYQFWSHRMYPKTSFKDTVDRVEKLCHTKRMQVRLSVWRDEFKGITKGRELDDDPDVIDLTEPTLVASEDDASEDKALQNHRLKSNQASSRASSLPPTSSEPGDDDFDIDAVIRVEEERLAALRTGTTARAPSPPPASSEVEDDDFDIDAVLRIEEDRLAVLCSAKTDSTPQKKPSPRSNPDADAMDVDEANLWETLEDPPVPLDSHQAPPSSALADDDDMWNIVDEMEQEERIKSIKTCIPVSGVNLAPSLDSANSGNTPRATNEEGLDDMYS